MLFRRTGMIGWIAGIAGAASCAFAQTGAPPASVPPSITVMRDDPTPMDTSEQPVDELAPPALFAPDAAIPWIPDTPGPPLAANFNSIDDDDAWIPPNPAGAVGPSHLLATTQSLVRIFNKTGSVLSTNNLCGQGSGCFAGSFFAGLGVTTSVRTARAAYDALSGHFIIVATADPTLATAALLIAVSATSDPTGVWYKYSVPVGSSSYLDWTTVGFNKDWIVVAANRLLNTTSVFQGANIYVFKKADLYANLGATRTVSQRATVDGNSFQPAQTYDAAATTEYLLAAVNGGTSSTQVRVMTVTGPIGAETVAVSGVATLSSAWGEQPGAGNIVAPQLGTANTIDTGFTRMNSAVYRNGQLWGAHTVVMPAAAPTRAAVQWLSINPATLVVNQFGRVYDTAGNACGGAPCHYAYPALSVNRYNDMLVGYSRFASNQYASANFSARFNYDANGTTRDDRVYKAGLAPYYKSWSSSKAWGAYSAAGVDPADDSTLWMLQEFAAGQQVVPGCTGVPSGTCDYLWGTWWGKFTLDCAGKSNGDACNGDGLCSSGPKACSSGVCVGTSPVVCSAGQCQNPGSCVPTTGACTAPTNKPNSTPCNDGNNCTQNDQCTNGACGGTPTVCTPLDQCHVAGSCNPGTGLCSNPNAPNGTGCNDNDACTNPDSCTSGSCGGPRIAVPNDVHNDLRLQKNGAANIQALWTTVTPDAVTSHYHLYRAAAPSAPFPASWPLQAPEPPAAGYIPGNATSWIDTGAGGAPLFYDLRSANACEDISP